MPVGSGTARAVRVAVFTAVCLSVSVLAHEWMGGAVPSGDGLLAAGGAIYLLAFAAAGRERSGLSITAALLAGEFALHVLFGATSVAAHTSPMPTMDAMPGMSAHTGQLDMVLGHLAAAAVSGWWLRVGERAAFALVSTLALLAFAPPGRVRAAAGARPVPRANPMPRMHEAVEGNRLRGRLTVRHIVVRRGPPLARA